jgi:hypothetical protein
MKKAILIGAAILVTSSAILIANNNMGSDACCDRSKCEQGVCKPADKCPEAGECCEKK